MREVTFLTLAEAVEIHNDMVGKYGGTAGVRCQRISVDGPEQPLDQGHLLPLNVRAAKSCTSFWI